MAVGKAKVTFEGDFAALERDMNKAFQTVGKSAGKAASEGTKTGVDAAKREASSGAKQIDKTAQAAAKSFDGVGGAAGKAAGKAESEMTDMATTTARQADRAGKSAAQGFAGVGKAAGQAASTAESEMADMASSAGKSGERAGAQAAAGFSKVGSAASQAASSASASFASVGNAAGRASEATSRVGTTTSSSFASVGSAAARASDATSRVGTAAQQAGSSTQEMGAKAQAAGGQAEAGARRAEAGFKGMDMSIGNIIGKVGRLAGAFAAVAGPAAVLKSGFDRLMNIQRAEIGFKNIGLTADQTAAQMTKLSDQVTGTSVSLSDAAKYSAMFAQSGVEMGAPMDASIKAFTNLSSAAQGTGTDVGVVMQQISAAGKLMGGDAMQLQQAGINIYKYVADYMGMSMDEVKKLGEQGKITFDDVVGAINQGMGDYAKEMGETLPAKIGNLKTALANMGATIIEPFIPGITKAVEFGTALVKGVVAPFKSVVAVFQSGNPVISAFGVILKGLGLVVAAAAAGWALWAAQFVLWPALMAGAGAATATFTGIMAFMTMGLTALRTALMGLWTAFLANPIAWVIVGIAALVAAFVVLWKRSDAFREFWTNLWNKIADPVREAIDAVKGAWDGLVGIFRGEVTDEGNSALARLIGADRVAWIISTITTVKQVWEDVKTAFGGGEVEGGGALARLVGIDTAERVMEIIGSIKDAWGELWSAFQGDGSGTGALTALLGDEGKAEFVVDLFTRMGDAARFVWDSIKEVGQALADVGGAIAGAGWDVITSVFSALADVGMALWDAIVQIGSAVWDLIQALAPVLMPVLKIIGAIIGGVIVAAFFLLIGALKVVSGIFQVLGTVISWLAENVLAPLIGVIGEVVGWLVEKLGGAVSGLVDIVTGVVSGIGDILGAIWEGLQTAWETVGQPVLDFIMLAFNFWWESVKLGFRLLQATFEVIWTALQMAWEAVGQPVLDWIVQKFGDMWTGVQIVLDWVRSKWDEIWNWVKGVYASVISPVVDWIVVKFNTLKGGVETALNLVKGAIQGAADKVRAFYDQYVQPMVDRVIRGFNRVKDTVMGWKDKLVGALSGAGSWLVDAGRNVVQGFINGIKSLAGTIGSAFLNMVPGWIKGPFKKALGIASPSKLFAGYGRNIGEGLIQGVSGMESQVAGAAQGLADSAASVSVDAGSVSLSGGSVNTSGISAPSAPVGASTAPVGPSIGPVVQADAQMATDAVTGVFAPTMASMGTAYMTTGETISGVSTTSIIPSFQAVSAQALSTATVGVAPAAASMSASMAATGAATAQAAGSVINPALGSIAATAWNTYQQGILPVVNNIVGALNHVSWSFATAATNIASQWSRIREATAQPVRFVIRTVFNDGIVGMWNSVSDLLGTTKMSPYPLRFATGGYVRGPGGPTDDKVPALLSNKEYVLNADAVKRIGVGNLNAMNSGQVHAAPSALSSRRSQEAMLNDATFKNIASRYAGGGIVEGSPAWKDLLRGYKWAQSRSGRPYVWGGSANGAGGTDCSGYMSGIADVILGGSGARQWATGNFPGTQGGSWAGGLASGFAVGIRNGGPGGGHTAGTIGGVPGIPAVNVESGGSPSRVKFGTGAVGATDGYFNQHHHLRVVEGGKFVPGMGSGPSMAQLAAEAMKPFKDKMASAVTAFVGGQRGIMPREYPPKVKDKLTTATESKIDKLTEEMLLSGSDSGGEGVQRWAGLVTMLLKRYGLPEAWRANTLRRMNQESGGNPRAINNWDINAKNGDPSKGLMQVIGSTFAAHRDPAFPNDIWHPTSNIAASMRYTMATYGSLPAGYDRAGGYAHGGLMPEGQGWFHKTAIAPERVLSPRQTVAFESLVSALDSGFAASIGWGGDRDGMAAGNSTSRVEVTQNIYGGDPRATADEVTDRLARAVW